MTADCSDAIIAPYVSLRFCDYENICYKIQAVFALSVTRRSVFSFSMLTPYMFWDLAYHIESIT
jgi:hypothetical protein